jgi:hypothetical protein
VSVFRRASSGGFDQSRDRQGATCGISGCGQPRWSGHSLCDGHHADAEQRLRDAEAKREKDQ